VSQMTAKKILIADDKANVSIMALQNKWFVLFYGAESLTPM
jgi:hypothetical protein